MKYKPCHASSDICEQCSPRSAFASVQSNLRTNFFIWSFTVLTCLKSVFRMTRHIYLVFYVTDRAKKDVRRYVDSHALDQPAV